MKQKLLFFLSLLIGISSVQAQGLPSNPEPGKCYVKCITKDEFKDIEETVQVFPPYTTLEVIPAVYKTVEERVLVKEATKKLVYVPAIYETVNIAYVKKEAGERLNVIPANFGKDTRTFEVYPKTSGWEYKHLDGCSSANKEACAVACFVEYPAQFRTVNISTLAKPASTTTNSVQEQNTSYKKRVIKTPARMETIEIPAEYTTIKRQVVASPAKTRSTTVAGRSETVTRTILAKKGGIETWESIDCGLLDANLLPILYEFNSARLTVDSKRIIDEKLLPILKAKAVDMELMSHTDSRGNDDYNLALSQQRANSVVNYLVSKGISRSRLSAKGYGESRLINRCSNGVKCSEEDHHKNRRTEFRVMNSN